MRGMWILLALLPLCACGSQKSSAGADTAPLVPGPPSAVVYITGQHPRLDALARAMQIGTPPDGGILISETTFAAPNAGGDPLAYYRTELPKQGWTLERDEPPGASDDAFMVFSREKGRHFAYISETTYIAGPADVPKGVPLGGYFVDVAEVVQP